MSTPFDQLAADADPPLPAGVRAQVKLAECHLLVRRLLTGDRQAREQAARGLADLFEERGDVALADVLRLPPAPRPIPSIATLAQALPPEEVGAACGRMLAALPRAYLVAAAVGMADELDADRRLDLAEYLATDVQYRANESGTET